MIITDKAQIKIAELRESNNLRLSGSDALECYELIESDLKLPADATFTRSSVAYLSDGMQVDANMPRFEPGKFGKAVMVEEGTENLLREPLFNGVLDTTYWNTRNAVYTLSIDTNTKYMGYNSLKIVANKIGCVGSDIIMKSTQMPTIDTDYVFSFYAKASEPVKLTVRWGYGATQNSVDITTEWQKYSVISRTGSQAYQDLLPYYDKIATLWIVLPQLEAKHYPTSFTDGTRADEKLTLPIEVLNHNAFTFEMWIKQSIVTTSAFSHSRRLLDLGQGLWLWNFSPAWPDPEGTNRRIIADFGQDASGTRQYLDLISQTPFSTVNFEYFAITFDGATFRFYRNGVLWSSKTPSKTNPFTQIVLGNAGWIIDDLRISNRARSDEEIAAAYQSGQPLPVDEWTTYKLDFDDKVRITTQGQIICNELIEI
jgi:hypothetical protein